MNLETTKLFFQFYPWIDKCMYQTFDDSWKWRTNLIRYWSYLTNDCLSMLEDVNKQWAWIFFSVNWNDNKSRLKEDITHINAWITEIDGIDKEDQMTMIKLSPIRPSMIVESKNWYHLYWFAKDWTIENWRKICRWLRNFFEWDSKAITLERVLRIPWFEHCKNEQDRFEINIVDLAPDKYTELEMLTAFSNTESYDDRKQKQAKAEAYQKKYESDNDDNFRKRVWDIDSEQMLTILSWTKHVCGDDITFKRNSDNQKQIIVNWKSTWCWIDSAGKIWTWKGAGWWPTRKQRVAWYWHFDWAELYRIIVDKYPAFKPKHKQVDNSTFDSKKVDTIDDILQVEEREDIKIVNWFSYWNECFDALWCTKEWELVTVVAMSNTGKTTFAMDMLRTNSDLWRKCLYINCEFNIKNVPMARWLYLNWKEKVNLTNLSPLNKDELNALNIYVKDFLSRFDYLNYPWWISREDLENVLRDKQKEWYELVVIDSFSKIDGNLYWSEWARMENQNKAMLMLQSVCLSTWLCVVNLHHTNKAWIFEWSWHILNISEVMILMNREKDELTDKQYTEFTVSKDKFISSRSIKTEYNNWKYILHKDSSER